MLLVYELISCRLLLPVYSLICILGLVFSPFIFITMLTVITDSITFPYKKKKHNNIQSTAVCWPTPYVKVKARGPDPAR
ncbi:hypothetical protein VZT92_002817 [Zoarces viviparus]|uniref:Uncharacterized protein n=1 Tax=Zoarces viviparus TaxID=48416 RepID=A0AAW1FZT9_ZOAVI